VSDGLPESVRINAWRGVAAGGELVERANRWGSDDRGLPHSQASLPLGEVADPRDWKHKDVGYGVLLPDSDLSAAEKAVGVDAPEPVRDLLEARPDTVLLRWKATIGERFVTRYFSDGTSQSPTIGLSGFGVAKGKLPRYVLIVGTPDVIPWSVQYAFETRHAVGRLPLDEEGLGNYIDAMLSDWTGADVDPGAPLMWTVSIPGDITAEMRTVIAKPLEDKFTDEPRLPRFDHLSGNRATGAELLNALANARPSLLVTSSHGWTEGDGPTLRNSLGVPVDIAHEPVALDALDQAIPPGAIWYAQACCSAGGDAISNYEGLLAQGSAAYATVHHVAELGPTVAPAATKLLGRPNPVRAVLGHVEPTFDWTLRVAETGQGLGAHIVSALSDNLIGDRQPVGCAFADYRAGVGELHTQWVSTHNQFLKAEDVTLRDQLRNVLTRLRLTAIDRQSLVLLGDPTVTFPASGP
jgi:hypothetical protein